MNYFEGGKTEIFKQIKTHFPDSKNVKGKGKGNAFKILNKNKSRDMNKESDIYKGFAESLIKKKTRKMFLKAKSLSPHRELKKPKKLVVNAVKTIEKHVQLSSQSFKKLGKKSKNLLTISANFNSPESNFLSSGGSTFYNANTSRTKRSFMNYKKPKKYSILNYKTKTLNDLTVKSNRLTVDSFANKVESSSKKTYL